MPTKNEISEFSLMIEESARVNKTTRVDAIVSYCEQTGLEIDLASSLISAALKAKIREESQDLNLLKKSSKLPV
jgi:hypothetical protein